MEFLFVGGIIVGAIIATQWLSDPAPVQINPALAEELASYRITDHSKLVPEQLFSFESLFTLRGFIVMVIGGFLVGFGTRYAGGCTSGHAIMGLSNLQFPSLVATVMFMIGGFIMANPHPSIYPSSLKAFIMQATEKQISTDTDFEVRSLDSSCINESQQQYPWWYNFKYLAVGLIFGIVFVKAEIISWFRIQEMFRLQSFHMYGVIGTAVVVGIVSVWLIKKLKLKTIHGEEIVFTKKKFSKGQIYGGLLFGLGWAITGACPGPLFAQIGTGALAAIVIVLSAIAGTWVYGYFRERLPH